ncbi:MAG: ComF family protein [Anaerolineales bacterium]
MKYQFYNLFWHFVDLVFPPHCGGCNELGVRWCKKCQQGTKIIQPPICKICGQVVQTDDVCNRCKTVPPNYEAVRAWAEFDGPIRNGIHDLKYRKNIVLGAIFAQYLVQLFHTYNWPIDIVVPVPLGKERQKQRGYNQAALIAQPLAQELQLLYNPNILQRIKETRSQVELSFKERQDNVKNAFKAVCSDIQGKSILIIDDVATSGSTMNACADALMKVGSKSVFGLTVARPVYSYYPGTNNIPFKSNGGIHDTRS